MATDPIPSSNMTDKQPTSAENIISILGSKLAATANARSVYGDPIHVHNRTIIPVAKFGYGFGAGSGRHEGSLSGSGAGGGGGAGAKPVGYIEISERGTRYVAISTTKRVVAAALAGIAFGYLLGRFRL